ncbi:hypothetical protein ABZZ79_02290 [Streptomyces sp. NPDC006458]|uniref:hypothetical protein n=1 Tax=Streptomyces sp. NPDC006458 TaxID=3154302 RepID=UPI0033A574FA
MAEQHHGSELDQAGQTRRRRAGIAAFLTGLLVALGFFAFFPGLPHVIDAGAVIASLAVGGLARWTCQRRMSRAAGK